MKNLNQLFGMGAMALFLLAGCKKYEDGPAFSLRSKEDRMANTWIVDKAYENNEDKTSNYNNYELYMTNDGDARLIATYTYFGSVRTVEETNGTWQFTNNKDNFRLDFEGSDNDAEYQILRLTDKELWVRQVGAELELQFREK